MTELPDYFPHGRPHMPGSEELPSAAHVPVPLTSYAWTPSMGWGMTGVTLLSILVFGVASGAVQVPAIPLVARTVLAGVLLCMAYIVPLLVLWVVARRVGVNPFGLVGLRKAPARPVIFLGVAVGVLGRVAALAWGVLLQIFGVELPGEVSDPTQLLPAGALGAAFIVIATVVLAPIAEEAIFRGVLLPSLYDRWGRALAMAMSSVVFAATHVVPITLPPLFVFALMLAWIFIRSRTLWTAVIAHAVFNAIGLAMYFLLIGVRA